jgi:hypothetical protein
MSRDFDIVLDEAISRLVAGEAVEDCLSSYPEHAGLLEPLLRMAAFNERALADVEPYSETASTAGKERLLAAAAQQRLLAAAAVEQVLAAPQRKPAPRPKKRLRLFALPARGLAAAALTLLLLVILGGGLAVASADSLPGDLLYPVKLATEQVRLFLTVDAQAKEELLTEFDEERRAEATTVLETGREVRVAFEGTLQSFSDSLWIVGGLQVTLDAHTVVEGDPWVGATVAVEGLAPGDGSLLASQLTVKGSGGMQEPTATVSPTMAPQFTMTPLPRETDTAWPTRTHEPEMTCTSCPTRTHEPTPSGTLRPSHTPCPTETREPDPTPTLHPTNTEEPMPTHPPQPTATDEPEPTHMVHPTNTKEPMPTAPPQPTATDEPEPTHMAHPTKTPRH